MTQPTRIGAVHALTASIEPTQAAFARAWPGVDVAHLMDGSLYLDRSRGTADEAEIARRIDRLIRHSADTGAQGILFTGSFFGEAVRQARASVSVPVLTSFDGVIEEALSLDRALTVMSTAPDSTTLLVEELGRAASVRGLSIPIAGQVVAGAMDALVAGEYPRHDELVLDAIGRVGADHAIVMAQFSMERVIEDIDRSGPVLGAATEGAAYLRRRLEST